MYQFTRTQKIRASLPEIWDFLSDPRNLKTITPPYMGFDIQSAELPETMYPGMMISYRVKPLLGIPIKWLTEITHVEEGKFFVDEQRMGPYRLWHHQHILQVEKDGILMKDIITYSPPFGFLGRLANTLFIRKRLDEIFEYRRKKLELLFGH